MSPVSKELCERPVAPGAGGDSAQETSWMAGKNSGALVALGLRGHQEEEICLSCKKCDGRSRRLLSPLLSPVTLLYHCPCLAASDH